MRLAAVAAAGGGFPITPYAGIFLDGLLKQATNAGDGNSGGGPNQAFA